MYSLIDKKRALSLLLQLGEELSADGLTAILDVYGGVAMSLSVMENTASFDLDAVVGAKNRAAFWRAVDRVTKKNQDLMPEWLNEGVLSLVKEDLKRQDLWDFGQSGGLTVRLPRPEQLLAMKVYSARLDKEDLSHSVHLCRSLGITSSMEIHMILKLYVKEEAIKKQNRRKGRHNCIHNFIEVLVEMLDND